MDRKILLLLALALLLMAVPLAMAQEQATVYYFYGQGCPNCNLAKPVIEELESKYPEVEFKKLEVWNSQGNSALYIEMSKKYGERIEQAARLGTVPVVFLGDKFYISAMDIKSNLEDEIKRILEISNNQGNKLIIPIPFLGDVTLDLNSIPLPVLGIFLGLVDGINPCTLSILLFLMAYLFSLGSRRKVFKVGFVYTLVVFIIYFTVTLLLLFVLGTISFGGFYSHVRLGIGIIVLLIGLLMIKDFFAYGRGISLGISGKAKPIIEKLVKMGTIRSAILLALFASIVELPCTIGVPLYYITLLVGQGITGITAFLYLLLYNIFYIVPLIVLIGLVYFMEMEVERAERWRERSKKWMRLIAGLIMFILGLFFVFGV
jgi:cytochrome c biogenesis protein CcdA/glutaredoxin